MSQVDAYVVLTVKFVEEDDVWTAECLELGTAAFGDTFDEAKDAISEMIELHLNSLEETGMLQRFFSEHNIKLHRGDPSRIRRRRRMDKLARPGEFFGFVTEKLPVQAAMS